MGNEIINSLVVIVYGLITYVLFMRTVKYYSFDDCFCTMALDFERDYNTKMVLE
jgi:hypothetical protein